MREYVSWRIISIDELAKTTPVNPPTVNKNTNPRAQSTDGELFNYNCKSSLKRNFLIRLHTNRLFVKSKFSYISIIIIIIITFNSFISLYLYAK